MAKSLTQPYLQIADDSPVIIERSVTPRGEIQLQRRGPHYEIISNGTFLMSTYNGDSEKKLVAKALEVGDCTDCSVLIGGLGVGYSLAEAVEHPSVREATVVEIEEKMIEWNYSWLGPVSGHPVHHPKARIVHADLLDWITRTEQTFDVICLDIDNGPDWTVFESNNSLYDNPGLSNLARILNPGGVISFWSASASASFLDRLKQHFSDCEEMRADREGDPHPDYIYVSRK